MDVEELGVRAMALWVFRILAFASFLPADLVLVGDATRVHRPDGAQLFLNPCNFFFHFDMGLFNFHSNMVVNIADNVKPANNDLPDANLWMDMLRSKVEDATMNGANMGDLENLIAESVKELVRPMLRHGAQLVADRQPMRCPDCKSPLRIEEHARERTVNTLFGPVVVSRTYGYCPQCQKRHYPADHALAIREADVALSEKIEGVTELSKRSSVPKQPFTMVIEPEARQWAQQRIAWLKRREDGALDVIGDLRQIRENLEGLSAKQCKALDEQIGYFERHKNRMDYKQPDP